MNTKMYIGGQLVAGEGSLVRVENPADGSIIESFQGASAEQAEQAIGNLKNLVEAAGSSMDKVIKTVVFIKNMDDFGKINEVYGKYFPEPFPARSCVEVARLPKDVLIEIEAIAAK